MLRTDRDTARRFILGKQGLWPGRRFHGLEGAEQAMRAMQYVQLDPLQMIARSHDLALHSRVLDYKPGMWEVLAYQERKFFDWGGWLSVRPMDELPHWRTIMRRERDGHPDCDPRTKRMIQEHAAAIQDVLEVLQARGTVSNRDFDQASRVRTQSYRGRKDSSLALYYLWRIGEVMTHHRENFERVYALAGSVAPAAQLLHESPAPAADRFVIRKEVSFLGLSRLQRTQDAYHRGVPFSAAGQIRDALLAAGELVEVQVDGWKFLQYALSSDAALLEDLNAGRIPQAWQPLESDTDQEAVFLAPLDPVCARGRAKEIFGFDYIWEVYKPEHQRKYGYYTLPVLWGDRLVARFDSKLDRSTGTFVVLGFWLEDPALGVDDAFAEALSRGFARFRDFLGAQNLDAAGIGEPLLRSRVEGGWNTKDTK